MKVYFILAAESLARIVISLEGLHYFVPPESLAALLGQATQATACFAHIALQINGINYLFHKQTLLVYLLLRFLKFKHLAQEPNLSTLPFKSP